MGFEPKISGHSAPQTSPFFLQLISFTHHQILHPMTQAAPEIFTETITPLHGGDPVSFRMIKVEGGEFWMGSEENSMKNPSYKFYLPTFWIAEYPVTQLLWLAVLDERPSHFQGFNRPVEQVTWIDITKQFLPKLNKICQRDFRLPSEAEWEFAARGGIYNTAYRYAGSNRLKDVGWYSENSHLETKTVGLKHPNALGVHDMSGNVWEWCADYWHYSYDGLSDKGVARNEKGININKGHNHKNRVLRGGSWYHSSKLCSNSFRFSEHPYIMSGTIGFRLAISSLHEICV